MPAIAQRRFATAQARHPWILFLDADEWLSAELQRELERRLPALLESSYAGALLRRTAWFNRSANAMASVTLSP